MFLIWKNWIEIQKSRNPFANCALKKENIYVLDQQIHRRGKGTQNSELNNNFPQINLNVLN